MAKTLKEIPTRSASAETKPLGVAMLLDDLDVDIRSQTVSDSLERVMPPPSTKPEPTGTTALAPVPEPKPILANVPVEEKKKPTTQMLSTPIPAATKKRLNRLRLEHSISTAFVLESALNQFFGDRTDEAIASDLLARGGRLRRNNG